MEQLGVRHRDLDDLLKNICHRRSKSLAWASEKALNRLSGYEGLHDVQKASAMLGDAIQAQLPIAVVGDYDVDGVTAAAVMLKALKAYGARKLSYWVPNRLTEGYGLNTKLLQRMPSGPGYLVTVDNGIRSIEAVDQAIAKQWKVIITDHHLPGAILPQACAIVNPKLSDDAFVPKQLAGVGVAFYLMLALRQHLKEMHWFTNQNLDFPNAAQWLDLVALGTVADMVPLDLENRILVHQGLERIKTGKASPGIAALLRLVKVSNAALTEKVFSHQIGPILNAAGRLEDMSVGLNLLMAPDVGQALPLAKKLFALNRSRRQLQAETLDRLLNTIRSNVDTQHCAKVLYLPEAHLGLLGLLATQVKDRFQTLAMVFTDFDAQWLKGSLRSIPGLNAITFLETIQSNYPALLGEFGGHAMAAGITIQRDAFPMFQSIVEKRFLEIQREIQNEYRVSVTQTDGYLSEQFLNLQTLRAFEQLGPWGVAFPEPVFTGEFEWQAHKILWGGHWQLQVKYPEGNCWYPAILFFPKQKQFPSIELLPKRFRAHYSLEQRIRCNKGQPIQVVFARFISSCDWKAQGNQAALTSAYKGLHPLSV